MSTAGMATRTLDLAISSGLRVVFVTESYDIDEPRDLDRLVAELAKQTLDRARIPHTALFLDSSAPA
jgi:hypothetical protein